MGLTDVREAGRDDAGGSQPEHSEQPEYIGRIDRLEFERHARSAGVERWIALARRIWQQHGRGDPAASRTVTPR
jgi:hypothetical protein